MTIIIHARAITPSDTFCGEGFPRPYDGWHEVTCRDCLRLGAARDPWLSIEPRRRLEELEARDHVS